MGKYLQDGRVTEARKDKVGKQIKLFYWWKNLNLNYQFSSCWDEIHRGRPKLVSSPSNLSLGYGMDSPSIETHLIRTIMFS